MKRFMMLLLILLSNPTFAIDCNLHAIYCRIVAVQPSVDREKAMEVSNILYHATKYYGVDPMVSIAVIRQETSWNFEKYEGALVIHKNGQVDIGLPQINLSTAIHYGINIEKLQKDLGYAIWSHVRLLRIKMRACNGDFACYHSTTPKLRERYRLLVSQYLPEGHEARIQ